VGELDYIVLAAGDILYDVVTHDWAVLIARKKEWTYRYTPEGDNYTVWVWEMFWTPVPDSARYTEESLLRMLEEGRLILYKK
tara:strand:- start:124 stop:369 length:246 start_codon:yes stop_codon:yes gene_type:complete